MTMMFTMQIGKKQLDENIKVFRQTVLTGFEPPIEEQIPLSRLIVCYIRVCPNAE